MVRGRVQGVGFRHFVWQAAGRIGVKGYVRNLDDGSVEVHATGKAEQLEELEALLRQGPPWADVRHLDIQEAAPTANKHFRIER